MSDPASRRRILIVNPNTSERITGLMLAEARRVAPPDADVTAVTVPFGPAALECPADLVIAAHAVLTVLAMQADACDAAIIGAFGDPGLDAARDLLPMPVFGLGEEGLRAVAGEGRRFAILTVGPRMKESLERAARAAGVADALAGIAFLGASVLDLAEAGPDRHEEIADAARACAMDLRADAVLLAGAPFSGMARLLAPRVPVPLFDGLTSALRTALDALAAGPRFTRPDQAQDIPGKPMTGVAPALARLIRARLAR